uniref:Uncharacterized protein n=1 Tax=Plectus sambesii TaxID=2011161 RepID=A0A914WMY1_9BILA
MLWLVVIVVLCATSAVGNEKLDPWEPIGNGGYEDAEQLSEAERIKAIEDYHDDIARAALQALDSKEPKQLQAAGTLATGESQGQTIDELPTFDQKRLLGTGSANLFEEARIAILREKFHRVLNHFPTTTTEPSDVDAPKQETPAPLKIAKNQYLSESDFEAKVENNESHMKVAGVNYFFPSKARLPPSLEEVETGLTTAAKQVKPVSEVKSQNAMPTLHFEETYKNNVEKEERHEVVLMSDDERRFLALLASSPTTQSSAIDISAQSEQYPLTLSDFMDSTSNDRHESTSAAQTPLPTTDSTLSPAITTSMPRSQFADVEVGRLLLPTYVHSLEAEDEETLNYAINAARKQPSGGKWLVRYYNKSRR